MSDPFFKGNVADAIKTASAATKMLIVSIQAKDNADCTQLDEEVWANSDVIEALSETVTIRLYWDTEDGKNFYSIYPVFQTPTIYFINGTTGQPVKYLMGKTSPDDFLITFTEAQHTFIDQLTSPPAVSPSQPLATSPSPTESTNPPPPEEDDGKTIHKGLSIEEQQKRLKARIEENKVKKAKEEQEEMNRKEQERIKNGKLMQETKRTLEEKKFQREMEERKKEKQEEVLAKKRIKDKIAQDKAERKKSAFSMVPKSSQPTTPPASTYTNSSTTEIAFRKLDGSTVSHTFKSTDTLSLCKNFVETTIGYKKFSLMLSYPRKTYTELDMNKSLRELQLVPNAMLIIKSEDAAQYYSPPPQTSASRNTDTSPTAGDVFSFLTPVYNGAASVGGWVAKMMWGSNPSQQQQQPQQQSRGPAQNVERPNTTTTTTTGNGGLTQRRGVNTLSTVRKDDEDEETKFYNGNSTQMQ